LLSHVSSPKKFEYLFVYKCPGLKDFTGSLSKFRNLNHLTLEEVNITDLKREDFPDSALALKSLSVSYTSLKTLDFKLQEIFQQLIALNLDSNSINELPKNIFGNFKGTLSIKNNPLLC